MPYKILYQFLTFLFSGFFLFGQAFMSIGQENVHDWENYPIWENMTKYSRTYIVDQKHKHACDTNAGTEKAPLQTIAAATQLANPGEKIVIHRGVYHEIIEPVRGGTATDNMISYESAPGHKVIIKGSKVLKTKWVKEIKPVKKGIAHSVIASRSRKLWMTRLHDTIFRNEYYPFKLSNFEENEYEHSPELTVNSSSPLALTRGMIFQNAQRMTQLNHYGDLIHVEGSFWVDTDKKTIHVHPFGNKDPNKDKIEIAIYDHLLKPKQRGVNYVQIKGLIFEHCANCFMREGGAVNTNGGHHWIIENNIIREINASGLEFGSEILEHSDPKLDSVLKSLPKVPDYTIVLDNKIYSCGIAGINCSRVQHAIIKNNEIMFCGWQEIEHLGECAGIKLTETKNSLISNNIVHHMLGAGIWLYHLNQYSRITSNIIHDISSFRGGLVLNASDTENLVDNNFLWRIDGVGINGNNSENQLYYHNLVAYTSEPIVKITKSNEEGLSKLPAKNNHISNNIFIDFMERMELSSPTNTINNNLFVFNTHLGNIELKKWQARLISKQGKIMRADADFNTKRLLLKWTSQKDIVPVPALPEVKTDFIKEKRGATTIQGPFKKLLPNCDYYVSLKKL